MELEKPATLDILPAGSPALSSTNDMPVVETKPDASPEVPAVPPAEAPAEEPEQPAESATVATDEQSGQPTSERGVGKALAKLRAEVKEAQRQASEEKEERLRMLALLEADKRAKAAPVIEETEPAKPRRDDFPDPQSWDEALLSYADKKSEWAARNAVQAATAEAAKQREQDEIAAGIKKTQDEFADRRAKFAEKNPDFTEVVDSSQILVPPIAVQAIVNHPQGPDLQYYLGKNPQEAKRLLSIENPLLQAMELGSILAKLSAPEAPKPAISNAPPPIKPIKAGTEASSKNPEEESMEEYAARRNKELRGGRDMRH
jgi:hypothetical protein